MTNPNRSVFRDFITFLTFQLLGAKSGPTRQELSNKIVESEQDESPVKFYCFARKADAANNLVLLETGGRFEALPIAPSRAVKLGGTMAKVGFPNIGLQGFAPKSARGEIASLSGTGDDARYFQISVPVQPGDSGGALVDERGNVVGVVSAKLNQLAALQTIGSLPENVIYAVKSRYLLSFLESVPEVSAKLKDSNTKAIKIEQVAAQIEHVA
jgi:S1-C subfamily serine protease